MTAQRRHSITRSHLSVYHDDLERAQRREDRTKKRRGSFSRLLGALACLTALSMLRLEPGSIRRVLYQSGHRALDCVIGTVNFPENFKGFWEANYEAVTDYEKPRVVTTPPSADIAYAVPVSNCPEAFVAGQVDAGRAFLDSMAMMKLNVNQVHEASGSKYSHMFYAIVHPSAVSCQSPDGTIYDRVRVLEDLGFWVKIWGDNVNTTAVGDPGVENAIYDNEALNNLATLNAFNMDDHKLVTIIEPTAQMFDLPEGLYDQILSDPTKEIAMSPQMPSSSAGTPVPGTPYPTNTDFVVIKPSQETFKAIQKFIQESPYDPVKGWNGTGNTNLGPAGILTSHYSGTDKALHLDPCVYGDAINDPTCNQNLKAMTVATLKGSCGEPWNCNYDPQTMPAICGDYIEAWHAMRSEFEQGCLNSPVGLSYGGFETDIYHGHCSAAGFGGYQILLPDNGSCVGELQTISNSRILPGVAQTQTFSLLTQTYTGNGKTCVQGSVTIPQYVPPFNIAIVLDVSGSTSGKFKGTAAGDVNGDKKKNTILDAEIASVLAMIKSIVDSPNLNNGNVDIGLIKFSREAEFLGNWPPADPNDPTTINPKIYHALTALRHGGITNFDDALDKAVHYFQDFASYKGGSNIMYFLSDGKPNTCGDGDDEDCEDPNDRMSNNHDKVLQYTSELTLLAGMGVHREAIGVGSKSDVKKGNGLWMVDSGNSPLQVRTTDALVDVLTANPVQGTVVDFALTKNGVAVPGVDKDSVVSGPTGFSYETVTLDGLNKTWGAINTIAASITMDLDGKTKTTHDQVVFAAQATVTGTITNLAMKGRRLTTENRANSEMCNIIKGNKG